MVFSKKDKTFIEACFLEKRMRGIQLVEVFPNKKWNNGSKNRLIKGIQELVSIVRKSRQEISISDWIPLWNQLLEETTTCSNWIKRNSHRSPVLIAALMSIRSNIILHYKIESKLIFGYKTFHIHNMMCLKVNLSTSRTFW